MDSLKVKLNCQLSFKKMALISNPAWIYSSDDNLSWNAWEWRLNCGLSFNIINIRMPSNQALLTWRWFENTTQCHWGSALYWIIYTDWSTSAESNTRLKIGWNGVLVKIEVNCPSTYQTTYLHDQIRETTAYGLTKRFKNADAPSRTWVFAGWLGRNSRHGRFAKKIIWEKDNTNSLSLHQLLPWLS